MPRRPSLVLSARLQAAGARVRVYDPVRGGRGAQADQRGRVPATRGCRSPRVRTRSCWSRSGRSSPERLAEVAGAMRGDLLVDGRNFLDPARVRGAGLATRALGRPARSSRRDRQRGVAACRRASGPAAKARACDRSPPPCPSRSCRSSTAPFIVFMLDWLRRHGVDDVCSRAAIWQSGVRNVLGDGSALSALRLRYVEGRARSARRRAEVRRAAASTTAS